MAAISSVRSGGWADTNTATNAWGATPPTNADDVTILNTHTVTLDTTAPVALTLTVNSGGTLTCSTTANSGLTVQRGITQNGTITLDMSAASAYACTVIFNNVNSNGTYEWSCNNLAPLTLKGVSKTRWTTTTGAITDNSTTTFGVTAATGWATGDKLVLASTGAFAATPLTDLITATISGTTVSSFTGTGTGLNTCSNGHLSGCLIGNFSSNLIIKGASSASVSFGACLRCTSTTRTGYARNIDNVQFDNLYWGPTTGAGLTLQGTFGGSWDGNTVWTGVTNNCFNSCRYALSFVYLDFPVTVSGNVFYEPTSTSGSTSGEYQCGNQGLGTSPNYRSGITYSNNVVFRTINGGFDVSILGAVASNCYASGCRGLSASAPGFRLNNSVTHSNLYSWANAYGIKVDAASNVSGGSVGTFYSGATCTNAFDDQNLASATFTDFGVQASSINNGLSTTIDGFKLSLVNVGAVVTEQSIYKTYGQITRYNGSTNTKRSTSSVAIKPTTTVKDVQYTVSIPCANGASVRVVGYVKADTNFYNGGGANWTAPTVSLSGTINGVTLTPATFTASASANNAFELCDISITNSSGADGNVTLTFTANAKSVTTGTVYFDGMPTNSPFVTKARHYGYVFDQVLPNATMNSSVSANEATAGAYTDFTVTGGASTSSVALTASSTFQKLYDYTQAWSCTTANLGYAVPCSAPVSGVLIAAGNLTTTGYTLNGSGSVAIGAYTLTASLPWVYTYTGGTFSQAASTPSFSGGTMNIGAAGTYTFTQAASMLVVVTPTSPSNYVFSSGTFTGTLTVNNAAAHAITVEVPAGVTTSSTGNTGGAITFVSPQVYQSVVITGFTAGSRIYIYDTEGAGELLFNGTVSAGETVISGSTCTWTDAQAAVANRVIFLRVAYVNGATAKEFIEVTTIGTCGITEGDKTVSYIAAQTADTVYDTNGVSMDGTIFAACGITFTDAATDLVNINIAADTVALKTVYAAFAWWIFTALGIDDDVAYIRAIDPANYELTSMKFRNTSTDPLKITGGYFYDSTGSVENCVDVAGSSGNIYPMPMHVVAYQTTGTYAITGDISTVLTAVSGVPADVLAAAATTPIHSDVRKVVGITVDGTGTDGDPWGPV